MGRPPLSAREPDPRWLRRRAPAQAALIDSGPLIALFNGADRWHHPVLVWLEANPELQLHTTWPVLTEVCALLARRLHNHAALDFLHWVQRGALLIDGPPPGAILSILDICRRLADLPLDLADASIAEAASRLKIRHVVSLDQDFDIYRDAQGIALTNLLRPSQV